MCSPRSALLQGLLVLTCLGLGCSDKGKQEQSDSKDAGPVVRVTKPTSRKVTDYAYFTGRIEAPESVKIQARVTGYLDTVDFVPGAEVKTDQRLFLIDPRPYKAALDRELGRVHLAEAHLKLAIADYARALEIAKTPGAISKQDVDKYAAARDEASAAVAAAKADSEAARLNVEFTRIISPIDGVVGRNLLTIGNLVKQDETLLTTVVSQDPMYAYFDIDEHALLRIQRMIEKGEVDRKVEEEGFPVEAGLSDEEDRYPHKGKIDFINNRIDPSTGTLQVRGTFSNPSLDYKNYRLLTPGMFVRIRLPIGSPHEAILVPLKAVGTDQGKKYLKVVNDKNVVEYRPVALGAQQPDGLQVVIPVKMVRTKDGLRQADKKTAAGEKTIDSIKLGERIIVGGLQFVHSGMHVTPHPVKSDDGSISGSHAPQ
ncbi:MAG: efflux RND transporter periplasmic adaptor subunit [Planctomycetes bacterium]|nr:efflux RND transporter periplasmic adaptor subunit [Planctomycetota bacterium]MBU4400935.1 efflux RND transporter periplasmic adaptor subunit [Planctomycetota bacterium]MCG2682015.1 efflux RND transporter periplasmic adaptor subunit [Planctomycetales bacterium]